MFSLIKKKDKAMEIGYKSYQRLRNYILTKMEETEHSPTKQDFSPCYTPKEMLDTLYNSTEYKDFVIDSLVVKKLCEKISLIKILVLVVALVAIAGILTLIGPSVLGIILCAVIAIPTFIFLLMFKEGKTYKEYYLETMSRILSMAVSEYSISTAKSNTIINKDFIDKHLDEHYDKYSTRYNCKFESEYEVGDDFNLELRDVVTTKDKDGNTTTREETVFSGFSIVSKNKKPLDVLKGCVIKIRADHSLFSALTEDTINSMVQSKRDFSFNSEKLNKHLDCKLGNSLFTSDVDQKMFEVTKVITPAFEERLLFLDERYNAFNMNMSDNEFSFTVNMKKDTYQKFKDGELFKFGSNYKDKDYNTNIFTQVDFEYDKYYPMLERLFLRKYFRFIYNYQMDTTRFDSYDNAKITKYEDEIREIMDMPYKEFNDIHKDYVKDLKEDIKERYNSIKLEDDGITSEDDKSYVKEIEKEKEKMNEEV